MPNRHDPPGGDGRPPAAAHGTLRSRAVPGLARFVLSLPGVSPSARPPPSVLLLARPGAESEEIFADLSQREDLCVLRVATPAAANRAIAEMPVALVVACAEMPVAAIDSVLAHLRRARSRTPVLALRERRAEEPAGWGDRVAVLRMPLLSGVLSRSIDVVLGMRRRR
jgi:hypothetical protein